MVYWADPTALAEYPVATAKALTVTDEETLIGAVYLLDEEVGVAPLVV